jgi:hypothetical protein
MIDRRGSDDYGSAGRSVVFRSAVIIVADGDAHPQAGAAEIDRTADRNGPGFAGRARGQSQSQKQGKKYALHFEPPHEMVDHTRRLKHNPGRP